MTIRRYHLDKGSITPEKFATNAVYFRILASQIEKKTGLAADSTGVKAESPKFKFSSKHVKKLIVRAKVPSIPSDATVRVEVYDYTTDSVLGYVEFTGAAGESEAEVTSLPSDGDYIALRVNVTTASATSGATFDLDYASLMVDYGIS